MLRLFTLAAIFAIALAQDCGGNWKRFGDTCYMVRGDRQFWGEARKRCQEMSADLPIVKSKDVNDFLTDLVSDLRGYYWIGLGDDLNEGDFKWVDGTSLTNPTYWASDQPNNGGTDPGSQNENCVELYPESGKWNDENCIAPQYYICARDINAPVKCDEANGWREYNDKCYLYNDGRKKYEDAEAFCNLLGGNLVSVNSAGESDFLISQQSTIDIQYWIGLNDLEGGFAGDHAWTDHSTWDSSAYNRWDANQPDNQYWNSGGDCAAVDHPETGVWQIDRCTVSKRFFCERQEGVCADGWKQFNGQCYQINGNKPRTWSDAKHYCEAQGAYLTTIMTDHENQFIASQMIDFRDAGYQDMYIGISDFNIDGNFQWVQDFNIDGNFQWVQGSSMDYSNWNVGMPLNRAGQEDCGSIYTGDVSARWDVMNCYNLQPFICKIQLGRPVTIVPPDQEIGSCPTGWQLFGDYCYYFSLDDTTTFSGAQTTCEAVRANLVSIHDENEQSFLSTRADGIRQNLWIGLHDLTGEGTFEWTDDTVTDFTNWAPGEPNNAGNGEDCVHLTASYHNVGMWNDLECDRQENYICKRHKDDDGVIRTPTPFPTPIVSNKCGDGWEYDGNTNLYNGRCYAFRTSDYKGWSEASYQCRIEGGDLTSISDYNEQAFINDYKGWSEASYQCRIEGGDLTSISDYNEQAFINARLQGYTETVVWFGASDLSEEGGWEWTDEAPFRYLNWNAGEPNNYGDEGEHCVELYIDTGKWNDHNCNRALGYVCKQSSILQTNFFPYRFRKLPDSSYYRTTLTNLWPKECAEACLAREDYDCQSFDYDRTLQKCSLSDVGFTVGLVPTDDSYPVDHYELDFGAPIEPPKTTVDPSFGCPTADWKIYGDYCYMVNEAMTEFAEARTLCNMQSSELVSIRDLNENNFLFGFVNEYMPASSRAWIGMWDLDQEMYYTWTDGSEVTFTNWAYYEPNNSGEEDCVEMWMSSGTWNDLPCTGYNYQSVCKIQKFSGGTIPEEDGCQPGWVWTLVIGSWNDLPCTGVNYQSVCKIQKFSGGTIPEEDGCQPGWKSYMSSCYSFNTALKSWSSAKSDCSASGGHLVVVNDKWESGFLSGQLGLETTEMSYWIGLSDSDEPGMYKWVDNAPILTTNWDDGQPDDRMGQCVAASSSIPKSGYWADAECSTAMPYVCEIQREGYTTKRPDNPGPTNPTNIGCASGWIGYGSQCFKVYEEDANRNQRSWESALDFCRDMGGDLASFHSSTEEDYIRNSYLPNDPDNQYGYWIGLNDRSVEGGYTWTDGTPTEFVNWDAGEPNDYEDVEDCVEAFLNEGRGWNDQDCSEGRHWICRIEKNKAPITPTPAPPATVCPTDSAWYYSKPYCYYVSDATWNIRRTWADADAWCNDAGSHLVSIHSDTEQAFINQVLKRAVSSYWIGLREYTVEGDYSWTDGTVVDYTNWNPGEPNDYNGEEQCGELETFDDGRWNDQACGVKLAFICKRDEDDINPITKAPTEPPTGGCPSGWYKLLTHCYRLYGISESERRPWEEARDQCQTISGSNLATIHNKEQQAALAVMLRAVQQSDVWVGLTDLGSSGKFHWTDGSNLDFTNWGPGQPDGVLFPGTGSGSCVEMMNDDGHPGDWNDVECETLNAFVCQQNLDPLLPDNPPDIGICEIGEYIDYFNSCFKMFTETLTYDQAKTRCEEDGTTLASIKDGYDEAFVETMIYVDGVRNAWIGMQDLDKDGTYTWLDMWPVFFTKWGRNEPSQKEGEGCVRVSSDMVWQDVDCENEHSFICKVTFDEMPVTPAPPKGYCPADWMAHNSNCYMFDSGVKRVTWPEAVYDCQLSYGAKLVSIHTKAENDFISKNARTVLGENSIWIGLNRNDDGGFVWDDESAVDYVNWANDEPNGDMTGENCVELFDDTYGKWSDADCYNTAGYVCQLKQLPYPPDGSPGTPGKQTGELSVGAIIGIVISVTIIVLALSLVGFFVYQRYQQGTLSAPGGSINDTSAKTATGFDNQLYTAQGASSGKVNLASDA